MRPVFDAVATSGAIAPALAHGALGAASRRVVKALARIVLPSWIIVWRGPTGRPRVALTFDDGPTDLTRGYLDLLDRFGARATFFVVGEACSRRPELVADIVQRGHEIGSHGYTHRPFPSLEPKEIVDELARTAALLPPIERGPRLVRPPHGAVSLRSLFACARAGFTTVLWSHDSLDCRTESAESVVAALAERAVSPGAILLLHEGQAWTMDALPTILGKLRKAGHELVTVGELLGR